MALHLGAFAALAEDSGSFLAPSWHLPIVCHFSSDLHQYQAYTRCIYRHAGKHTYTSNKINRPFTKY